MKFTYKAHRKDAIISVSVFSSLEAEGGATPTYLGKLDMLPFEWSFLKRSLSNDGPLKHEFVESGDPRPDKPPPSVAKPEPEPTGDGEVVVDMVIKDLGDRAEFGENKYGTKLRTNNGRNALMDAYQEAIDLVMYLRQEIAEREE